MRDYAICDFCGNRKHWSQLMQNDEEKVFICKSCVSVCVAELAVQERIEKEAKNYHGHK